MERLLRDAEALTGVKYDINNLADVYSAIHAIQEQLGITGTTAKEAEKTITGSANMMKAAWQNVLSAIAGGGDLDRAINNLVYSIQKYFKNIVPVVERSLVGIGRLIEQVAPMLVQNVASALIQAIPSLINAIFQMIAGLAKGIWQGVKALFTGSGGVTAEIKTSIGSIASSTLDASEGMEELGDATEKAGKKAQKSMASFDELNTVSQDGGGGSETLAESLSAMPVVEGGIGGIGDLGSELDASPFEDFFSRIKNAISPLLEPLQTLGSLFQNVLSFMYNEFLKPLGEWTMNELAPVVIEALAAALRAVSKILAPVFEGFKILYNFLKPVFDWIGEKVILIIGKFGDAFSEVGKVFEEKKDKIHETFSMIGEIALKIWAIIEPILNWIIDLAVDMFDTVDEIAANLIDIFHGITQFISEVFSGDWASAWRSIVGVFKSIANILIESINILIRGLNRIKFNLPNWDILGKWAGKTFGINIPQIPKLAQGAVIPPNREFLAVLGDQKHGTNIEAPLDTIKQAVAEVLAQVNVGGGGFNGRIEVPVIINGREIARAVRESEQDMGKQTVFGGFANAY